MHFAPYFGVQQTLEYDKEFGTFAGWMSIFFRMKDSKIKKCEEVRFFASLSPHQGLIPPHFAFQKKAKRADFGAVLLKK